MKLVPTPVEQYVNRVPRRYRTYTGVGFAFLAAWCPIRLIFLISGAIMFAGLYWSPVSLIFTFVLWGVIGVVAVVMAVAFLTGAGRPE